MDNTLLENLKHYPYVELGYGASKCRLYFAILLGLFICKHTSMISTSQELYSHIATGYSLVPVDVAHLLQGHVVALGQQYVCLRATQLLSKNECNLCVSIH